MSLAEPVARAGGAVLAGAFGLLARLRGTRALHPVGVCGTATLSVRPGPPSGVALLDDPGPHDCQVRWSRATGRRGDGLDVEGFALRVEGPAAGDLLLASTGTGVVGRHVLTLRRRDRHGPVTTLLPLSTPRGALLLRLDPDPLATDPLPTGPLPTDPLATEDAGRTPSARPRTPGARSTDDRGRDVPALPTAYRLMVAAPGRPWHERGALDVTWADRDCTRRHDPVGHPPVGTWTHPLWARLRDPSYAASQEVAADPITPEEP